MIALLDNNITTYVRSIIMMSTISKDHREPLDSRVIIMYYYYKCYISYSTQRLMIDNSYVEYLHKTVGFRDLTCAKWVNRKRHANEYRSARRRAWTADNSRSLLSSCGLQGPRKSLPVCAYTNKIRTKI